MDYSFLEKIREAELNFIIQFLPPKSKVLEIGAGAGWQAKKLTEAGFIVEGIDVEQQNMANYNYADKRVFDVKLYDGFNIPFEADTFDCVYSSNVLEHIAHVEAFQKEISRVLKKDGLCVHILPSAGWRFWSIPTYYWVRFGNAFFGRKKKQEEGGASQGQPHALAKDSFLKRLIIRRHGERGNVLSEFYLFSRIAWKRLFKRTGWQIVKIVSSPVFFSGEYTLSSRLSIDTRRKLGTFLGRSANVFVLKNTKSLLSGTL